MSIIKIDNKSYQVGEVALQRNAEIIYDPVTQGVMLDFSEMDDAVATKYTFTFTVQPKLGQEAEYDAFYYDITSPKSIRLVELPFARNKIVFEAKIKTVNDGLQNIGGLTRWEGLTVTFEPVRPQRYTEGASKFAYVQTTTDDGRVLYIKQAEDILWYGIDGVNWAQLKSGEKGDPGTPATVKIGEVTTLPPGSMATVENVGTQSNVILKFGIPQGVQGVSGNDGKTPQIGGNGNWWIGDHDTGVLANWQPKIDAAIAGHDESPTSHGGLFSARVPLAKGQAIAEGLSMGPASAERYLGYTATTSGVANEKVDIEFPAAAFAGTIEVTLVGNWGTGNATGSLVKIYEIGISGSLVINAQYARYDRVRNSA